MTCYQQTTDPFDVSQPLIIPADITEPIDPSNMIASFPTSEADWMAKDPFELLPWDLAAGGNDQNFNMTEEIADGLEYPHPYATRDHTSPMGYKGYTFKTEDTLSYESPVSDGECETWSPTHNDQSGSQSPASAPGADMKRSGLRRTRMPSASSPEASPVAHTMNELPSPNLPRKLSTATTSSSMSSSSTHTISRPVRSSTETDPAAAMKRKKAAHNAIEKRYRTNMNAKFLALGNAIPRRGPFATQLASNKGSRKQSFCYPREPTGGSNGSGPQQQQQQNKSEILTNALAYIHELQEENTRLKGELSVLKENLLPRGSMMWRP